MIDLSRRQCEDNGETKKEKDERRHVKIQLISHDFSGRKENRYCI